MCQYPIGSTLFLAFCLRALALIASAFSFWIHPRPCGAGCTKRRERTGFATLQRNIYIKVKIALSTCCLYDDPLSSTHSIPLPTGVYLPNRENEV
ncbi:hypothetical protein EDD16DRAFT_1624982, partial [Pisolithus croceorrhizus]